jgi:predicted transcriptional regulator
MQLARAQGQDKDSCWPSVEYLAKQCSVSEHTIIKAKRELIEHGLITVKRSRSTKGGFAFNVYHVTDIWDENKCHFSKMQPRTPKLAPGGNTSDDD